MGHPRCWLLTGIHGGPGGRRPTPGPGFLRDGDKRVAATRGGALGPRAPPRVAATPARSCYRSLLLKVAWTSAGARTISDMLGAWKMMLAGPRLVGVFQING